MTDKTKNFNIRQAMDMVENMDREPAAAPEQVNESAEPPRKPAPEAPKRDGLAEALEQRLEAFLNDEPEAAEFKCGACGETKLAEAKMMADDGGDVCRGCYFEPAEQTLTEMPAGDFSDSKAGGYYFMNISHDSNPFMRTVEREYEIQKDGRDTGYCLVTTYSGGCWQGKLQRSDDPLHCIHQTDVCGPDDSYQSMVDDVARQLDKILTTGHVTQVNEYSRADWKTARNQQFRAQTAQSDRRALAGDLAGGGNTPRQAPSIVLPGDPDENATYCSRCPAELGIGGNCADPGEPPLCRKCWYQEEMRSEYDYDLA